MKENNLQALDSKLESLKEDLEEVFCFGILEVLLQFIKK